MDKKITPQRCVPYMRNFMLTFLFLFGAMQSFYAQNPPTVNPVNNFVYSNGDLTNAIVFSGSTVPGTVYYWYCSNNNIGLPANSGQDSIPAFTVVNNTYSPLTATIFVNAFAENQIDSIGNSISFTITVNPDTIIHQDSLPVVYPVADQYYYNGDSVGAIIFSGTADTYIWTTAGDNIGMNVLSGTNTTPPFFAVNSGYAMLTATFTVTPVKNNISGLPITFNMYVFANDTIPQDTLPVVYPVAHQYYYNGDSVGATTFNGTADTYLWTVTGDNIGMNVFSGTNSTPIFFAVNSGYTTLTATFTVTPMKNSVRGLPITFNMYVLPNDTFPNDTIIRDTLPTVNPVSNQRYNDGDFVDVLSFTGTADTYNWSMTGDNIGLNILSGTNSIPAFYAVNGGNTVLITTVTVTPVKNNVSGMPIFFNIYVSPHYQDSIPEAIPVQGISVYPQNVTISTGQWRNISVSVYPYNASNRNYTCYIDNPAIVYLDTAMIPYDSVFVQGLIPGTTFIVFETVEGGFQDTCWITVTNETNIQTSLSGSIYLEDTTFVTSGLVFLYKESNAVYQFVDSVIIDSTGYYQFTNVGEGNYLVQAWANIPGTLPTYCRNASVWTSATVITVSSNTPITGMDILIIGLDSLTGSSIISGYVGNDDKGTKSIHKAAVENPYEGATVFLQQKEDNTTIAITSTDANGFFEFANIPVGNYIIVIDIIGLDMIDYSEIDITEDGQVIENQNYIITEEGIESEDKGTSSITQFVTNENIILYPNPAQNVLHIQSSSVVEQVTIYDINGKKLSTFNAQLSTLGIDISHLANGMYLVKLKTKEGETIQRIVKE